MIYSFFVFDLSDDLKAWDKEQGDVDRDLCISADIDGLSTDIITNNKMIYSFFNLIHQMI